MSVPPKRPWWVMFHRSKALLAAILWTVLAVFNVVVTSFSHQWLPQLLVFVSTGFLAVGGWAGYAFYRRHPEGETAAAAAEDQDAK